MAGREKLDALKAIVRNPPENWRWDFRNGEPVTYPDGIVAGCAMAMATHYCIATADELVSVIGEQQFRDTFISPFAYGTSYHHLVTREMVLARLESLTA